jgi:hypothetical protein
MFKSIFGSEIRGKILLFLYTNGESYPNEMKRIFGCYLNSIQYQLAALERDGVLYSRLRGKIRLFGINPRYPLKKELSILLEKILTFIPAEEKERLYTPRRRPRLSGKPLH